MRCGAGVVHDDARAEPRGEKSGMVLFTESVAASMGRTGARRRRDGLDWTATSGWGHINQTNYGRDNAFILAGATVAAQRLSSPLL